MANNNEKWYFTKEQLENTPSRKLGYDSHKELSYRQRTANLIQDIGHRLEVSQLCICTAIVYMHRFYTFHSFTHFPWHQMAAATIFLAGKEREESRDSKCVIYVANRCYNPENTIIDFNSERYLTQVQNLTINENVLLATLGFDLDISIPHTYIERYCQLEDTNKHVARIARFIATASLHLTTMCLQYKPKVVACFCIDMARKRCKWGTPLLNENKEKYSSVDPTVTAELLQQLTKEFHVIFEACPSSLREKFNAVTNNGSYTFSLHTNPPFDTDPQKVVRKDGKDRHLHRPPYDTKSGSEADSHKHRPRKPHEVSSNNQQQQSQVYNMLKERKNLAAQQKALTSSQPKISHSHHHHSVDPKLNTLPRTRSVDSYQLNSQTEPKKILREASRSFTFGLATKSLNEPLQNYWKESVRRDSQVRSDSKKGVQAHSGLFKDRLQTNAVSLNHYPDSRVNYRAEKQQIDPTSRSRMNPSKIPSGQRDSVSKHNESKPYIKLETDNIKDHLTNKTYGTHNQSKLYRKSETDNIKEHYSSTHDKTNAYLNESVNSTAQEVKLLFSVETPKCAPKKNVGRVKVSPKTQHSNGCSSSKPEPGLLNDEEIPPPKNVMKCYFKSEADNIKKHCVSTHDVTSAYLNKSLNCTSPKVKLPFNVKTIKSILKQTVSLVDIPSSTQHFNESEPGLLKDEKLSLHNIIPTYSPNAFKKQNEMATVSVTSSTSSSEPKLRPVMEKIDQVECFENIMCNYTVNSKETHQIPDVMTSLFNVKKKLILDEVKKELTNEVPSTCNNMKPSDVIPPLLTDRASESVLVNGLETNCTIIRNLLKETQSVPHLPKVAVVETCSLQLTSPRQTQPDALDTKHLHRKSKKKTKEKHKRKKKSKEKKKRKDKDCEKHKEPVSTEPVKIDIYEYKIQPLPESSTQGPNIGLKIKIVKDKIKTENVSELSESLPIGDLKIPKAEINGRKTSSDSDSKKRERDCTSEIPQSKIRKSSHEDFKQNDKSPMLSPNATTSLRSMPELHV